MERTKSEGLPEGDRPAHWGAGRKRIRCISNGRRRVRKKQKEAIRRTFQMGLPANTGTTPVHFVARSDDPLDHPLTLWIRIWPCGPTKRVSRVLGPKAQLRSLDVRRPYGFAAGPSGPLFDPEGQAPTLWTRTSWSTGSEGLAGGGGDVGYR